jgi:hypothetical protein
VLARVLEAAGLSTLLITPMPIWAERLGAPRTLAIEFPFAQILGQPHQVDQHRRVLSQALQFLENAAEPGSIVHSAEIWPQPTQQAIQEWQPSQPSPIVQTLSPKIRALLRKRRSG